MSPLWPLRRGRQSSAARLPSVAYRAEPSRAGPDRPSHDHLSVGDKLQRPLSAAAEQRAPASGAISGRWRAATSTRAVAGPPVRARRSGSPLDLCRSGFRGIAEVAGLENWTAVTSVWSESPAQIAQVAAHGRLSSAGGRLQTIGFGPGIRTSISPGLHLECGDVIGLIEPRPPIPGLGARARL